MSLLPPPFAVYDPLVVIILLFVDGLLFGFAVKKAATSVILLIVALLLASVVGLTIPFLSVPDLWTHVVNIGISQARHLGAIFYGFPIFWLIGFALGIWKG
jgi:hypothetical protein